MRRHVVLRMCACGLKELRTSGIEDIATFTDQRFESSNLLAQDPAAEKKQPLRQPPAHCALVVEGPKTLKNKYVNLRGGGRRKRRRNKKKKKKKTAFILTGRPRKPRRLILVFVQAVRVSLCWPMQAYHTRCRELGQQKQSFMPCPK